MIGHFKTRRDWVTFYIRGTEKWEFKNKWLVIDFDKSILTMTSLAYCTASFSVSITLSVALKKMKIIVLLLRRFISCMRQISFPKGNKHFSYWILIMFSHSSIRISFNPFHANGLFLYPLKKSENLWFSNVFRGYRKRPVAWNGLLLVQ